MAAQGTPQVFNGAVYGTMLVANEEIAALADRVSLELPRIVERIRLIDQPRFGRYDYLAEGRRAA